MDADTEELLIDLLRREGVRDRNRASYLISAIGLCAREEAFGIKRNGKLYLCYSHQNERKEH